MHVAMGVCYKVQQSLDKIILQYILQMRAEFPSNLAV